MSKDYLLGIDIGTSACKVAIFNKNGKVMASANGDYPVYYPHEGWAQQKPDEWWHAVCGAICECLETGNISGEQIAGVGIDGQSWSAIAIDHGLLLQAAPAVGLAARQDRRKGHTVGSGGLGVAHGTW